MSAGNATPAFEVSFTPIGRADYHDLRADLKRDVDDAIAALERGGCAAAHYRLAGSGSDVGHICVIHLLRDWRLILAFPSANEVVVLLVGRHLRGARSVYERLYRIAGADAPAGERDKPPCCEDGNPPVNPELVSRIVASAKRLRRG